MRDKYIEKINEKTVRELVEKAIDKYGTEEKIQEAAKVADVVYQLLRKKGIIKDENYHDIHVDLMLGAAMLHNLFFEKDEDKEEISKLFLARERLIGVKKEVTLPNSLYDMLFDILESQMGEDTPIKGSKPNPNTPQELFSFAVWFARDYKEEL